MRTLTIHQSDAETISVLDDSDEPLDEYCSQLANLMKMGNVSILKTSSASVVLRPSKITGIKVEEGAVVQEIETPPAETPQPEECQAKQEIVEDIITDVDN